MRFVAEEGGFDWISDIYDDDLFYWLEVGECDQLIISYMFEVNDMCFVTVSGYITGGQFFDYLKDAFDVFYVEGDGGRPVMMFIGLYCCLIGWPGKLAGLKCFIDYIAVFDGVWCLRRIDIVRYWAVIYLH